MSDEAKAIVGVPETYIEKLREKRLDKRRWSLDTVLYHLGTTKEWMTIEFLVRQIEGRVSPRGVKGARDRITKYKTEALRKKKILILPRFGNKKHALTGWS